MVRIKYDIDDYSGEKLKKQMEKRVGNNVNDRKKRQILDCSSHLLELEVENEEEVLYLIHSMSYTLGSVAFEISQFSLAFMLETASRSAAQELAMTLDD
ncbi:MAG: hypothetical protein ACOC8P_02715 [Dichotomicrobium sp.]